MQISNLAQSFRANHPSVHLNFVDVCTIAKPNKESEAVRVSTRAILELSCNDVVYGAQCESEASEY